MGAKPEFPVAVPAARRIDGQPKAKVSIAVETAALEWANDYAKARGVSLSAVVGEALYLLRQRYNLGRLLEELWPDEPPITEAERQAVRDEWASVGFRP
jgi:hypothetical protein